MSVPFKLDKYKIFFAVIAIFLGFTLVPLVWKSFSYNKAEGTVKYFYFTENKNSRRKKTTYYPIVEYQVSNNNYLCKGSRFQHEEVFVNDIVAVLYNPNKPKEAYVYTAMGYWAPSLMYIIPIPIFLFLIFGLDMVPKYFTLKKNFCRFLPS